MSSLRGDALRQVVDDLFTIVKDRSNNTELVFICPQPGCGDATGNRSVNLKTGLTHCFRCNNGGDFVSWARYLGYEVHDEGGVAQARPIEELVFDPRRDRSNALPIVASVPLPKGFAYCKDRPKSVYTELIGEMAERKNLTLDELVQAQVGFTKLDPKWEPYAIFPCFEYGQVVYYQGRTYVDVPGESTKLFPSRREVQYGAKYWVYGIDELREAQAPIAIAEESILNVLSLRKFMREHKLSGAVPVCVFKHYISKPQARKLMNLPFLKEICLLYDHDATDSSWEKSPLIADKVRVTVAEMPPGPGGAKNDPNDDVETAWQVFEERQQADAVTSLSAKLKGNIKGRAPVDPNHIPKPRLKIDPLAFLDLK